MKLCNRLGPTMISMEIRIFMSATTLRRINSFAMTAVRGLSMSRHQWVTSGCGGSEWGASFGDFDNDLELLGICFWQKDRGARRVAASIVRKGGCTLKRHSLASNRFTEFRKKPKTFPRFPSPIPRRINLVFKFFYSVFRLLHAVSWCVTGCCDSQLRIFIYSSVARSLFLGMNAVGPD